MGVLPVPEEVKNMHGKIEQVLEILRDQNRLLEKIVKRIDELESDKEKIAQIGRELKEIGNSLTIIKDNVRLGRVA
jgi:hypothetical protein